MSTRNRLARWVRSFAMGAALGGVVIGGAWGPAAAFGSVAVVVAAVLAGSLVLGSIALAVADAPGGGR